MFGVKYVSVVNGCVVWDELCKFVNYVELFGKKVKDLIYLILIDVEMLEMDGYILIKNIKLDLVFVGIFVFMYLLLFLMLN